MHTVPAPSSSSGPASFLLGSTEAAGLIPLSEEAVRHPGSNSHRMPGFVRRVQPSTELVVGRLMRFFENNLENWELYVETTFQGTEGRRYRHIRSIPRVVGGTVAEKKHIN